MNPAAEARAKVKAAHPEAVVVERGRNSIKHRLADAPDGKQRFALDCSIGPLHYLDAEGQWQEIEDGQRPPVWEPKPRLIPVGDRLIPVVAGGALDKQVGAGADDGYSDSAGGFYDTDGYLYIGKLAGKIRDAWYRFTGISGLSGATIDVSYISTYLTTAHPSSLTIICADDQAAPAAPSDQADHAGRTRTTAGVDWDGSPGSAGFNDSPSINTVIQELADDYDPSVIQILHDDDGSANGAQHCFEAYETDTAHAAKLHIEYTAAGPPTGQPTMIRTQNIPTGPRDRPGSWN